jgi:2-phosphosulfolactate phosphatase
MTAFRHVTLDGAASATGVVVVVDVLRAFTTAAYALGAGAEAVVCVGTVEEALVERARRPGALAMGEIGGRPIPGFDLSNSPADIHRADVAGRTLVQRTTAGTQGIVRSPAGAQVFAASFVCAGATARAVAALSPATVTFVATGVDHRDGEEDRACAEYLEALLRTAGTAAHGMADAGADGSAGRPHYPAPDPAPDPAPYLARVRASDAARPFLAGDDVDFRPVDVDLATTVDAVAFALPVHREHGLAVLRPVPPPRG